MKNLFISNNKISLISRTVSLLTLSLIAASFLLVTPPSFAHCHHGGCNGSSSSTSSTFFRTSTFFGNSDQSLHTLTAHNLLKYCIDQNAGNVLFYITSVSLEFFDPNNGLRCSAQGGTTTPIVFGSASDLTFTGACQDILQNTMPDVSNIEARLNNTNNSNDPFPTVECFDNGSNSNLSNTFFGNNSQSLHTLITHDLLKYCVDQNAGNTLVYVTSVSPEFFDPNNSLYCLAQNGTKKTIRFGSGSGLTFTGACQDVLQNTFSDASNIEARLNNNNNSDDPFPTVECFNSSQTT